MKDYAKKSSEGKLETSLDKETRKHNSQPLKLDSWICLVQLGPQIDVLAQ